MDTRFVLIETSHAGNVGAVARAIKTMGFDDLVLVAPRWSNVLRREETIQRASGALDVLEKSRIVDTLDEALSGVTHVCASAMVARDFGPPTWEPRRYFEGLLQDPSENQELKKAWDTASTEPSQTLGQGIAFLFGSERFGMRNEDVYRCHVCLRIPSNPEFGSLNISAAVQLIAYEWRQALGGFAVNLSVGTSQRCLGADCSVADAVEIKGLLQHLELALTTIGFLDPQAPKKLMPRLNQLFNRAVLLKEDVHILRGIAKAILHTAKQNSNAHASDMQGTAKTNTNRPNS